MLSPNKNLFVSLPAESVMRILHPGTVVSIEDDVYTAELEEEDLRLKVGQEVLIHYEAKRTFTRQPAEIEAVRQGDPKPAISFAMSGKAVSTDSRGCYRVPLAFKNLTAKVGPEKDCRLLEVSETGFAIIASEPHTIGDIVDATLCYRYGEFSGRACVRSIKELGEVRKRYGFSCMDKNMADGSLPRGLYIISCAIHRDHLGGLRGSL
jgi:hypothetical protein